MATRRSQHTDQKNIQEIWQTCSTNCGSRCALRLHVANGQILWTETDNNPDDPRTPQLRACLRGRALRYWLSCSERLNEPLRRTGPRGSGQFEPISWDEALDTIADHIRYTVEKWGNESILIPYATAIWSVSGSPFERLLNCYGGHLGIYGDYSSMQLQAACKAMYGDDGYYTGSLLSETANSDLVVLFGSNPGLTRIGGASGAWRLEQSRERAEQEGHPFKLITIDPRHADIPMHKNDEWIPIRPGTDAAFVAGVAWVLITEDLVDTDFLHRYCIGYDGDTMPNGVPSIESYRDYILGHGIDQLEKTPVWAARITGCPSVKIVSFARELASSQRAFIMQGWGPQRTEYGVQSARAICMLSLLTGNFGLPGTNSGTRERLFKPVIPDDPVGDNPVKTSIPAFMWTHAIEQGVNLTKNNAGIRESDRLNAPVKMIINHAGNALTNQHADINKTHDILADENLCEFIVGIDVMMTDSMKYADIILPDIAQSERDVLVASGNSDGVHALINCDALETEQFQRRTAWDMALDLARRLGVEEEFCKQASNLSEMDALRLKNNSLPENEGTLSDIADSNIMRFPVLLSKDLPYAYGIFREDPENNPLPTPSGKIEIYSLDIAERANEISKPVDPIPSYMPAREGSEKALADDSLFQFISYHGQQSANSSFANVEEIESLSPRRLSMNPIDASRLDIASGMSVVVENDRGAFVCKACITPRIMPGVLSFPAGAWHDANMTGDRLDWGACANTVTSDEPTGWAWGNGHNSCLVRVRKLTEKEQQEADLRQKLHDQKKDQ